MSKVSIGLLLHCWSLFRRLYVSSDSVPLLLLIDFTFILHASAPWLYFSINIDKGNAGGQILDCFFIVIPSLLHGSRALVLKTVCSSQYPSYCRLGTLLGLVY